MGEGDLVHELRSLRSKELNLEGLCCPNPAGASLGAVVLDGPSDFFPDSSGATFTGAFLFVWPVAEPSVSSLAHGN